MCSQKANAVAVGRLESRIDPCARAVSIMPPAPCKWDDCEVIPLSQDGPWDTRELLFVGLSSEFKPVGMRVEVHDKHTIAQKLHA